MPTTDEIKTWRGQDAYGSDGDKIGSIEDIYLDERSGEPEWVAIRTGLFGTKVSFAPLSEAGSSDDGIRLPYDKSKVKDAPNVEADGQLSEDEEAQLYAHYGLEYDQAPADRAAPTAGHDGPRDERTVGHDVSGPTTDEAMTRSEEELAIGRRQVETGRARLRKYVVTEDVQTTVPVQREEVRVEREPITDANVDDATDGPAISEEEHEVVLRAEEPVVDKRVVPKERVRLDTDQRTEEREVSEQVRKEHIEADTDAER